MPVDYITLILAIFLPAVAGGMVTGALYGQTTNKAARCVSGCALPR